MFPMGVHEPAGTDEQRTNTAARTSVARAVSMSRSLLDNPQNDELFPQRSGRAPVCLFAPASVLGLPGFTNMPIVVARGTDCRSRSSRFGPDPR